MFVIVDKEFTVLSMHFRQGVDSVGHGRQGVDSVGYCRQGVYSVENAL